MCARQISATAVAILLLTAKTFSQTKYEAGLGLGAYVYQGDLVPGRLGSLKTISPGIHLSFAKPIFPLLTLRAMFTYTKLRGDETKYNPGYRQFRAFKFTNGVKELSLLAQYNIFGNREYEPLFEPYVFAGAGLSFMNVKRDYSGFNAAYFGENNDQAARLAQDAAVAPPSSTIVFPLGAGLRYNFSEKFSLNMEAGYRFTRGDYVDGYSISANPKMKDKYYGITAGLIYKIGKKSTGIGCPTNAN